MTYLHNFICKLALLKYVLLLFLTLVGENGYGQSHNTDHWYRVTSSTDVWWGLGHIYITKHNGTDSIHFTGFTNLGVTVWGTAKNGQLLIPGQTVHVKSSDHKGPLEYDIIAQAEGTLTDSSIVLQFYMKPDTGRAATGAIKAIRWSWPQQWESSKSHAPDPRRDTVIKGVKYTYVLYDLNRRPGQIGERFEHNIKNGRWLYSDNQGLLEREVMYVNDTLHGWAVEYHNWATPKSRSLGMYIKGKQTGQWTLEQRKDKHSWITGAYYLYDTDGTLVSKALTYTNGKPNLEMFYNKEGKMIWYRSYDKKGNLTDEGEIMNTMELQESAK